MSLYHVTSEFVVLRVTDTCSTFVCFLMFYAHNAFITTTVVVIKGLQQGERTTVELP